jgi:hypothetical protein
MRKPACQNQNRGAIERALPAILLRLKVRSALWSKRSRCALIEARLWRNGVIWDSAGIKHREIRDSH